MLCGDEFGDEGEEMLLLYGTIRSQDPKFPAISEHLSRFP